MQFCFPYTNYRAGEIIGLVGIKYLDAISLVNPNKSGKKFERNPYVCSPVQNVPYPPVGGEVVGSLQDN